MSLRPIQLNFDSCERQAERNRIAAWLLRRADRYTRDGAVGHAEALIDAANVVRYATDSAGMLENL